MDWDKPFHRLISNSGWLLCSNTIVLGLCFVQGLVLARQLGPEQYGILAIITTFSMTMTQFVDSRMWQTAIKFVVQFRENGDSRRAAAVVKLCYIADAVTGVLAFLAILLFARPAAGVFIRDPSAASLIRLYAISVLLNVPVGTAHALLRIGNRFGRMAVVRTAVAAFRLIGVLTVVCFGLGLRWVLAAYLAAGALDMVLALLLGIGIVRQLELPSWLTAKVSCLRGGELWQIVKFAFFSNLTATSRLFTSRMDTLVVSYFTQLSDVGLYKLARQLVDVVGAAFAPVNAALYPEFSRLAARNAFGGIQALRNRLSLYLGVAFLVSSTILTVFFPPLIRVCFGTEYAGAGPLAQMMIWRNVWVILIWVPGLLLSLNRAGTLAKLNWADALNYTFFVIVLTAWKGVTGASAAMLVRFVVWTLMAWTVVRSLHIPRQDDVPAMEGC